jgi:hypothetical protein
MKCFNPLWILVLALLLFPECGDKKKPTQSQEPCFDFPNSVGSSWHYRRYQLSNFSNPDSITVLEVVDSIVAVDTLVDGREVKKWLHVSASGGSSFTYVLVDQKGVWEYWSVSETTYYQRIVEFPLRVGRVYYYRYGKDSVLALEAVSVPAGVFEECYKVRWYDRIPMYHIPTDVETWFKSGVGIVKRREDFYTLRMNIYEELTNFQVK